MDSIQVNQDPHATPEAKAEQEAHEKAMLAAAEEGAQVQGDPKPAEGEEAPAAVQRPDDIPEKFWDAEKGEVNVAALLKSQQDAEAALKAAQRGDESTDETGDDTGETGGEESASSASDDVVANASAEYAEKGELSDATYESLAKQGLDRSMVDAYIAGQEALVGQLTSAAYSEFDGSQENFTAAQKWAADNLSEDEIAALDVQLGSDNPAIVKQGAAALAEKYAADADVTPEVNISGGGNRGDASGAHFKSSKEMQDAMADKRYANDPAYRQEVADKISRAAAAGINLF